MLGVALGGRGWRGKRGVEGWQGYDGLWSGQRRWTQGGKVPRPPMVSGGGASHEHGTKNPACDGRGFCWPRTTMGELPRALRRRRTARGRGRRGEARRRPSNHSSAPAKTAWRRCQRKGSSSLVAGTNQGRIQRPRGRLGRRGGGCRRRGDGGDGGDLPALALNLNLLCCSLNLTLQREKEVAAGRGNPRRGTKDEGLNRRRG